MVIRSSLNFRLRAEMRASFLTFLGILNAKPWGVGPKTVPPPLQIGERE
jgi:hypothetical protein